MYVCVCVEGGTGAWPVRAGRGRAWVQARLTAGTMRARGASVASTPPSAAWMLQARAVGGGAGGEG